MPVEEAVKTDKIEKTTIAIFPATKNKLDGVGVKSESYDDIICRLVDMYLSLKERIK